VAAAKFPTTTKISIKTSIIAVAVAIIVAVATDVDVIVALTTFNRDVTVTVAIIVAIVTTIAEKTTATTSTTNDLGAVSSLEFGEEAFCAGRIQVRNLDESHSQTIPVIRVLPGRTISWTILIAIFDILNFFVLY
jgi:hypothetical protein